MAGTTYAPPIDVANTMRPEAAAICISSIIVVKSEWFEFFFTSDCCFQFSLRTAPTKSGFGVVGAVGGAVKLSEGGIADAFGRVEPDSSSFSFFDRFLNLVIFSVSDFIKCFRQKRPVCLLMQ